MSYNTQKTIAEQQRCRLKCLKKGDGLIKKAKRAFKK